ncbi:16S rRNA (cytosine(967)-C(5))-methyltransferase [Candidatus Epulonipiscium fishelsonii]|uniref:16S rRNA (Cytosine(967)-C(5))-methyltransferase n=1 Tax=Candidatus Epulonipiscium fishelsonii TaxID=77094 RepID=A0ACC8XDU7_9FIRM|nr:16S rRNA (cytosine(967)-C(5))-methyltransferase [Epulopiscium sp. SCG-B05WGA-EpuloA1]ONI41038.1 16S rRNA (cytosine(967)-C(5))-methyltransferase [Epulopiscium sp. SCG-B11WGA-EpuloA1]
MKTIRENIVDILVEVEKSQSYVQLVLKEYLEQFAIIDRKFITEIVNGTIKHQITLDYYINTLSKTPVNKMKPFIRQLIRMSAYQILYLDKIPSSATINEAVNIVKRRKMTNLSGFVNGILRNLDRQKDTIALPTEPIEYLSVKNSIPEWIIEMWRETYSNVEIDKICTSLNARGQVCGRINTLKSSKEQVKALLSKEDIDITDGKFGEESFYLSNATSIGNNASFKKGLWTVQDESAMLVSKVLNPQKGDIILDVCAAPGGKSTHIAQLIQNEGQIISTDIYEHKLELIQKNADRLGATCITLVLHDGTIFKKEWEGKFDKILLDVPCSGLGILKKKSDIKYKRTLSDIEELVKIQKKLIDNNIKYLKQDGILVYSTCTISKLENEDMVEYILKDKNMIGENLTDLPEILEPTQNHIQILPYMADTDGFFIAKFKKVGN